jgi:co-chaperonin GroES (HSP10)
MRLPSSPDDGSVRLGDAPKPKYRGEAIDGFPWLPIGTTVIVLPSKDEVTKTSGGIFKPTTDSERRRSGIIVAVGPGAYLPYIGFVSPKEHYGVRVRDCVFCRMDNGIPIGVDGIDYLMFQPEDIMARARENVAVHTRAKLAAALVRATAHHEGLGEEAGDSTVEVSVPTVQNREVMSTEEFIEERRRARGKATKKQVLVSGLKED